MIRDTVWHHMIDAKYKAIYIMHFNSYLRSMERVLETILIVTSSASVAAWMIWQHLPYVWAILIGLAELIRLLKPIFPFFKEQEKLSDALLHFERLHLAYERLWSEMNYSIDNEQAKQRYWRLREKDVEEFGQLKEIKIRELKSLVKKTETEWNRHLVIYFKSET